jgi:hypothetical protein
MTAIDEIVKTEGSPAAVAAKLTTDERPCSRQLVEYWQERGYVTPTWAQAVAKVYRMPLHRLNPKIYPKQFVA